MMNVVDIAVGAAIAVGAWRGSKRGLPGTLPGVVGWTVTLVTGAGCFHWAYRGVAELGRFSPSLRGLTGMVATLVLATMLVRRFNKQIRQWGDRWVPAAGQARWGMVAGMVRAVLMAATLMLIAVHLPIGPLRPVFTQGSLFGRILFWVVPPPR
jgi:hypothetical protein